MMQMECDQCSGTGESIAAKNRCTACRGDKICEQTVTLPVTIPRGAVEGQKITVAGEGHKVCAEIIAVLASKR